MREVSESEIMSDMIDLISSTDGWRFFIAPYLHGMEFTRRGDMHIAFNQESRTAGVICTDFGGDLPSWSDYFGGLDGLVYFVQGWAS